MRTFILIYNTFYSNRVDANRCKTLNVNIFLSPDLVDGSREAKNQNVFLLKVRRSSSKRKDKENGGSEGGKNGGHVSVNNIMNVAELCVR